MHDQRRSGILLHPTSLPGRYGIGTLNEAAYHWVDFLHQRFQADQIRITGKGAKALIRTIPIAGGAKGQNLPKGLAGLVQKIDPMVGGFIERANAVAAR